MKTFSISRNLLFSTFLLGFSQICQCYNETTEVALDHEGNLKTKQGFYQVCGYRSEGQRNAFTRIVGGITAEKYEFPWQASINVKKRGRSFHLCGAAVIGASWLLTAAHCTNKYTPRQFTIVAGDYQISRIEGTEQLRKVSRIYQHAGYDPVSQQNDISILRLQGSFYMDGLNVAPVCLPSPGEHFTGKCVVSGWGRMSESGTKADIIQKVLLPVIDKVYCKKRLNDLGYTNSLKEHMMCAGYKAGLRDACQGDSGGPFVCAGKGNLPYIAGIVSWGIGCARKDVPGIYTEVSHFVHWIDSQIGGYTRNEDHLTDLKVSSAHITPEVDTRLLTEYENFDQLEALNKDYLEPEPATNSAKSVKLNSVKSKAVTVNREEFSSEEDYSSESYEDSEELSAENRWKTINFPL